MTPERTTAKRPGRYGLAGVLVGGSLLLGLTAAALSYLGSSLVIGPAWRAGTVELRERGARIYFESCAGFSVEPRFWPECVGDADEKRARGARKLVEFCTGQDRYVRFFGPEHCLSEDRPPLALTAAPRGEDLAAGATGAVAALATLGILLSLSSRGPPASRQDEQHAG